MKSFAGKITALLLGLTVMLAAVLVGAPAQPARALGCVLGYSLGSAARSVGISCPQIEGASGAEHWGAAGGACNFGWESNGYPKELLDFLGASGVTRQLQTLPDGSTDSLSIYRSKGKTIGSIYVVKKPDGTFAMHIAAWNRPGSGFGFETLSFDCARSSDGPMYQGSNPTLGGSTPSLPPLPLIGSPASPSAAGAIVARGSMSTLGSSNHLLRLDVTNTGTAQNVAVVQLDLAGYRVDGFPTLPAGATCEAAEGLVCSAGPILPGQTVTLVLLLHSDGNDAAGASVDVAVTSVGLAKSKINISSPSVLRKAAVTDFYSLERP